MDVLLRVDVLPAVLRGLRDAAEVAATAAVNGADVTDAMQQLHVELSALRDRFYRDADADDACENDSMWFDQRAGLHVRAFRGAVASADRALVAASGAGCSSIMILATLLEICTYWRGSLDALLVLVEEATRSGGPSPTARQLLARAVQRRTFFSDAMLACVDGVPRGAEHAATMRQRWTTFITALTSVPDRVAAVHGHVAASGSQSQKAQRPLDRLPFFNHLAAAIVYALRKSTTSTMHLPLVAIAMEKLVRLGYAEQIALAIVEQFAARQRKVDLMHVMQSLAQRSQEQLLYKLIVQIRERLLDCPAVTLDGKPTFDPIQLAPDNAMEPCMHALRSLVLPLIASSDHLCGYITTRFFEQTPVLDLETYRMILLLLCRDTATSTLVDALFQRLLSTWSDPMFIKYNAALEEHRRVSYCLLIISQLSGRDEAAWATIVQRATMRAVPFYIESSSGATVRQMGLFVAETLTAAYPTSKEAKPLQFGLEETEETRFMRRLVAVSSGEWMDTSVSGTAKEQSNVVTDAAHLSDTDSDDSLQPFEEEEAIDDNADVLDKPIAAPRYLRDCIEYLRDTGDNDTSRPQRIHVCLKHAEAVVRQHQDMAVLRSHNLAELCMELARRLLHLHDNFNLEGFQRLRRGVLVATLVVVPDAVGALLIDEFWNSRGINLAQRLDILDIIKETAHELSQPPKSMKATPALPPSPPMKELQDATDDAGSAVARRRLIKEAELRTVKTRYFHPHSRTVTPAVPFNNHLYRPLSAWFPALCQGLWTNKLEWLREETGLAMDLPVHSPSALLQSLSLYDLEEKREVKPMQATTFLLITKWIATLAGLLFTSGPNDPWMGAHGRQLAEVIAWYCKFGCQRQLVEERDRRDGDDVPGTTMPIISHPQFRSTLLFVLWVVMQLVLANVRLCDHPHEVLPFGLVDAMTSGLETGSQNLDGLIHWLLAQVMHDDSDAWNRKMAAKIIALMKERMDGEYQPPQMAR